MNTIEGLISQAAVLAKAEHGEREYTYRRILHYWRSSRKRGQKGQWYTAIGGDRVTREDYDSNREQGKADWRAAGRGELKKTRYYDYRRDQVRDGWQDALIAIIESADEMPQETESVDTSTIPEVKALVDAAFSLLDTAHREYEDTDWTVDQWLADEPTVAALDAALDPFRATLEAGR